MRFCGSMLALSFFALGVSPVLAAPADPAPSQPAPQARTGRDKPTAWDQQAAAEYLDDRLDLWFEKARKLRTGQGITTCVSCHLTVPYALARPALRKAAGASQPTPQEARLLDETLRRVDTYGSHDPLSKSKAEQSCGTEAVLNLLILAGADTRQDRRVSSAPTRKALEELWKEQRADGAWNWLDTGLEPYESTDSVYYGAALAAMAVGTAAGYSGDGGQTVSTGLAKLRSYAKANYPEQNLHSRTWMLLASTRLAGLLSRDQADALKTDLQNKQNTDGGWSLYKLGPWTWSKASPPYEPKGKPEVSLLSKSDAYATGLIAYALRQAGMPADHPSLRRATAWLETNQQEWQIDQSHWNCWRTYSLNYDHEHGGDDGEPWQRMFMSDAATAFAALALLPSD
ncbi:MAG TPA: prenyltransferase/squalene oxidase repeat-containing protein [Dongiaceae bacterium]|nr:prenyltransferase/squalene oxidase repeat-containing protein [Dongiaceae bacterium]